MREIFVVIVLVVLSSFINVASAFPDGAPWGAANPAVEQNCAACHFDAEAAHDSETLNLEGLPEQPYPGEIYDLEVNFIDPNIVTAGFQLIARAGENSAGLLTADIDAVEFIGASIRSTAPLRISERAVWAVRWQAPEIFREPIVFYLAASAANDDGSPFGDTIHFRSYSVAIIEETQ